MGFLQGKNSDYRHDFRAFHRLRHRQSLPRTRRGTGVYLRCGQTGRARPQNGGGIDSELVFRCDVASDDEINQVFADLGKHWDGLDGLVHSIGFAPKEALSGDFLDSISREAFNTAHEISAYSLPALAKAARPMMRGRNSAIVALSYWARCARFRITT